MKLERILAILVMILERKVLASELAEKFEVSTRTIYRDMDTLLYAGFPVVALPGKNGGFTMLDTYKLATFTFSEAEKQILLEALEARSEFMLKRFCEKKSRCYRPKNQLVSIFSLIQRHNIVSKSKQK